MLSQVMATFHKLFEHMPVQSLTLGRSQKVYLVHTSSLYIVFLGYTYD